MRKDQSPAYSYIETLLPAESELQLQARASSAQLGLAAISLSPTEARLTQFLCQLIKPKKIIEIGTLTGLSCLYFLESLPQDGCIWTLEKSPEHIQQAKANLATAIQEGRCQILEGDAKASLQELKQNGPFDVIFIDGNKSAYLDYGQWALENCALGGLIIADNVFLSGAVWGDQTQQKFNPKQINSVKSMTEKIMQAKNFRSSIVPTQEGLLIAQRIN